MIRRFFASFFLFLFGVVAVYFIANFVLVKTVISPSFLSDDFYQSSYDALMFEFTHSEQVYQAFGGLDSSGVAEIVEGVFEPDDVRFIVDDLIEQVETVVPEEGFYTYALNFSFLKDRLDLLSENLADSYYDRLPKCETISEFTVYAVEDLGAVDCLPEQLARKDFALAIKIYLDRELFSDLSNSFDFKYKVSDGMTLPLGDYIAWLTNIASIIGFALMAVLLIIIALIIFKPWSSVLAWEFRALFWPSFSLILVFGVMYFLPSLLSFDFGERLPIYERLYKVTFLPIAKNISIIAVPTFVVSLVGGILAKNYHSNKSANDPS